MRLKKHGFWYHLLDVLFNIVVIVAIVAGIRTFLVSPFQVEGSSMVDTLTDKEYIIINKFAFLLGTPGRGDVVVFRPPNEPKKYYVKRVIGLPGDAVTIKNGFVFVKTPDEKDVTKLDESSYLSPRNLGHTFKHPPSSGDQTLVSYDVPEGKYFLLGDNRQGSLDSRSFTGENGEPEPFVQESEIKGRVWFIALPITKIHALEAPEYGL
ncbi:MAG: signal peptidase I [Candidatus Peribacteraceae bacterium]|nr:signal peptidase I [Candidatus Peribacteraceae bacterium]